MQHKNPSQPTRAVAPAVAAPAVVAPAVVAPAVVAPTVAAPAVVAPAVAAPAIAAPAVAAPAGAAPAVAAPAVVAPVIPAAVSATAQAAAPGSAVLDDPFIYGEPMDVSEDSNTPNSSFMVPPHPCALIRSGLPAETTTFFVITSGQPVGIVSDVSSIDIAAQSHLVVTRFNSWYAAVGYYTIQFHSGYVHLLPAAPQATQGPLARRQVSFAEPSLPPPSLEPPMSGSAAHPIYVGTPSPNISIASRTQNAVTLTPAPRYKCVDKGKAVMRPRTVPLKPWQTRVKRGTSRRTEATVPDASRIIIDVSNVEPDDAPLRRKAKRLPEIVVHDEGDEQPKYLKCYPRLQPSGDSAPSSESTAGSSLAQVGSIIAQVGPVVPAAPLPQPSTPSASLGSGGAAGPVLPLASTPLASTVSGAAQPTTPMSSPLTEVPETAPTTPLPNAKPFKPLFSDLESIEAKIDAHVQHLLKSPMFIKSQRLRVTGATRSLYQDGSDGTDASTLRPAQPSPPVAGPSTLRAVQSPPVAGPSTLCAAQSPPVAGPSTLRAAQPSSPVAGPSTLRLSSNVNTEADQDDDDDPMVNEEYEIFSDIDPEQLEEIGKAMDKAWSMWPGKSAK